VPQTDIHKLIGYFAGLLAAAAARYGFDLPLEIAVIIFNGFIILVSTLVGKRTNPTGANASTARHALEAQVVKNTADYPVPR
jgi:hypothetical protein